MTVRELINRLLDKPMDALVLVLGYEADFDQIDDVEVACVVDKALFIRSMRADIAGWGMKIPVMLIGGRPLS